MRKSSFAFLWVFQLLIVTAVANAGEFGNIFGSEELEARSRQASAKVLRAIEIATAGLRMRELKEASGSDQLAEAAQGLREAASEMKALSGDAPQTLLSADAKGFLANNLSRIPGVDPASLNTVADVYIQFITQTFLLADVIEEASKVESDKNAFRLIAKPLSDYLTIADTVVGVQGR